LSIVQIGEQKPPPQQSGELFKKMMNFLEYNQACGR